MTKIYRARDIEPAANGLPRTGIFDLYDTNWMAYVCNLIKESCDPAPVGWRAGIAKSLREKVLSPVDILIDRWNEAGLYGDEFNATDAFHKCIENVADVLLMSGAGTESNSYSTDETRELADELRNAWTKFIAITAAIRMYDDLPRELLRIAGVSPLGVKKRQEDSQNKLGVIKKVVEDLLRTGQKMTAEEIRDYIHERNLSQYSPASTLKHVKTICSQIKKKR